MPQVIELEDKQEYQVALQTQTLWEIPFDRKLLKEIASNPQYWDALFYSELTWQFSSGIIKSGDTCEVTRINTDRNINKGPLTYRITYGWQKNIFAITATYLKGEGFFKKMQWVREFEATEEGFIRCSQTLFYSLRPYGAVARPPFLKNILQHVLKTLTKRTQRILTDSTLTLENLEFLQNAKLATRNQMDNYVVSLTYEFNLSPKIVFELLHNGHTASKVFSCTYADERLLTDKKFIVAVKNEFIQEDCEFIVKNCNIDNKEGKYIWIAETKVVVDLTDDSTTLRFYYDHLQHQFEITRTETGCQVVHTLTAKITTTSRLQAVSLYSESPILSLKNIIQTTARRLLELTQKQSAVPRELQAIKSPPIPKELQLKIPQKKHTV